MDIENLFTSMDKGVVKCFPKFKGKRFKIYRNLHRQSFSIQGYIKDKKGYRVVDRANCAIMENVMFKVMQSGRDRVIKEKRKNVHAFLMPSAYKHLSKRASSKQSVEGLREIYYNPYKYNSFVYKDTGEGLEGKFIRKVLLIDNKVYEILK
jgi:hypothetical protein